ncbi:MAG: hypothetical protein M0Z68_12350 [Gammaproteobacteria bacterium]|nr:hypothetical protein [Gammaproteobacteria bacterium]
MAKGNVFRSGQLNFMHTFTTGRLVEWYRAGLDVTRELPKFATYLGHVDVSLTYWYVEAVPDSSNWPPNIVAGIGRGKGHECRPLSRACPAVLYAALA